MCDPTEGLVPELEGVTVVGRLVVDGIVGLDPDFDGVTVVGRLEFGVTEGLVPVFPLGRMLPGFTLLLDGRVPLETEPLPGKGFMPFPVSKLLGRLLSPGLT